MANPVHIDSQVPPRSNDSDLLDKYKEAYAKALSDNYSLSLRDDTVFRTELIEQLRELNSNFVKFFDSLKE